MLNKILIAALFIAAPLIVAQEKASSASAFVGTEVCGACHKSEKQGNQLGIWKQSAHAKAYETLKTDKANEIATKLGYKTAAAETEACLKCHASGYNVAAELKQAKFKVEDGVQCETCHGPGSEYKNLKIMKNKDDAVAHGLLVYDKVETLCVKCHNSDSPTYKEMDMAAAWDKIKHTVPAADKK